MGVAEPFPKYKLFVAVIFNPIINFDEIIARCGELWGAIDYISEIMDFSFTDYYEEEMGRGLKRFFIAFKELVYPSLLADIKIASNNLENEFLRNGRRFVNLDPGLINLSRVILATTKDNAHRIPLRDGIYAEITLLYRKKDFLSLPWTYPDYREESYKKVLSDIRNLFKSQISQSEI
ncbi:DUF4416 family protein [Spirochaetia bacterium 38H-sp]|uniref:DUF4416 family protein n=1 Tax=Rarispira pelagica TaxID=3141764 RepID=A0ABU9UA49_9SPIR